MINNLENEDKKSLVDIVVDQLIGYILRDNMQPGDKIPTEAELIQMLGVSRSTVREAVRRLETRNILEVRQGAGTFVSDKRGVPEDPLGITLIGMGVESALQLSDVRLTLEPEFAALAAMKATREQMLQLQECCEQVEDCIRRGENYRNEDIAFHNCIASCSGNQVLENIVPVISSSIKISIQQTEDAYRQYTFEEHRQILASILRRDPIGARYGMAAHLNRSREFFARKVMGDPIILK